MTQEIRHRIPTKHQKSTDMGIGIKSQVQMKQNYKQGPRINSLVDKQFVAMNSNYNDIVQIKQQFLSQKQSKHFRQNT